MISNNKNNDAICSLLWTHAYSGTSYKRRFCCLAKNIDELKMEDISDYWNHKIYKKARLDMLNGKQIKYCEFCYNLEKNGIVSRRQQENGSYIESTNLPFQTNKDGSVLLNPSTFDYRSIACNIQCVNCNSESSSKHIQLYNKTHNQQKKSVFDPVFEKKLANDIIRSVESGDCKGIHWAGGEPFISNIHWDVLTKLQELRKTNKYIDDIALYYITNGTISNYKGLDICSLLKNFKTNVFFSIDGVEETFEYGRDGASWEVVKNNFITWNKELKNVSVATIVHLTVLLNIEKYVEFLKQQNVDNVLFHTFYKNRNRPANFLDVCLLPDDMFDRITNNAITVYRESNLPCFESFSGIINMYKGEKLKYSNIYNDTTYLAKCKYVTQQRDKHLTTNINFEKLLSVLDLDTYNWYKNIDPLGKI